MMFLNCGWHNLRSFGNSKIVKSNYVWIVIIPIIAKIINAIQLKLVEVNSPYILDVSFPFSWIELFMVSIFFAIASIVFNIRCPSLIKDNENYSDFQSSGKTTQHLVDYFESCCRSMGSHCKVKDIIDYVSSKDNEEPVAGKILISISKNEDRKNGTFDYFLDPENICSLFWFVYDQTDKQFRLSFIFSGGMFLSGLLMLLWINIQNILFVFDYVVQ